MIRTSRWRLGGGGALRRLSTALWGAKKMPAFALHLFAVVAAFEEHVCSPGRLHRAADPTAAHASYPAGRRSQLRQA